MENNKKKKPLTTAEAAKYLSVSPRTLCRHLDEIPHVYRFGRYFFDEDDLWSYLKKGSKSHD